MYIIHVVLHGWCLMHREWVGRVSWDKELLKPLSQAFKARYTMYVPVPTYPQCIVALAPPYSKFDQ